MAMKDDDFVFPALLTVAQALSEKITEFGVPVPEFIGVVPGDALIPDYCCGGMAWVRLVNVGEWAETQQQVDRWSTCSGALQATIEVGILRCAPSGEGEGEEWEPPTIADQLDAARIQMADMRLTLEAIRCSVGSDPRYRKRVAVSAYTPVGPAGQCLGGRWQFDLTSV